MEKLRSLCSERRNCSLSAGNLAGLTCLSVMNGCLRFDPPFGPRVLCAENLLQLLGSYVCIDLRCRDIGVPQNGLDGTQVGAIADHVCGATMAQAVRRRCAATLAVVGGLARVLHDLPDSLPRKRCTARVHE